MAEFIGVLLLLPILAVIARPILWLVSPIFFFLNRIMWFFHNPLRFSLRRRGSGIDRANFLLFYPVIGLYWLLIYVCMAPIRLINAIYFDLLLFWSLSFSDKMAEVFFPKRAPVYRRSKGIVFLFHWIVRFPIRLFGMYLASPIRYFVGILMAGFHVVVPTFTMYHGTRFSGAATDIAQRGHWYVGQGDYAGAGIYFGLQRRVAQHYSKGQRDAAIIIARVTLFPCRNLATFPKKVRDYVGLKTGSAISYHVKGWRSVEHWRRDGQWFEYCLLHPKKGDMVNTWRAQPIAVLKQTRVGWFPERIWGGATMMVGGAKGWLAMLLSWGGILFLLFSLSGN